MSTPEKRWPLWLQVLYALGLLAFLPAFGYGIFWLTRTLSPNGWQPDRSGEIRRMEALAEQLREAEQRKTDQRDEEYRKLTRELRGVKDDASAQSALVKVAIRGGEAASLGYMEALGEVDDKVMPPLESLKSLKDRKKLSPAAEELIAEIKKVARAHPRAYYAAVMRLRKS